MGPQALISCADWREGVYKIRKALDRRCWYPLYLNSDPDTERYTFVVGINGACSFFLLPRQG